VTVIRVAVPARPERAYEIRLEPGGLDRLGDLCSSAPAHRYAVIADSHVAELYGPRALRALAADGKEAELFTFPAGEWNKSASEWTRLCGELMQEGFGRDSAVVALGGGVTGDLAGFVASTYARGLPVIQVPTTLLSMLDSSVGGKTGIDAGQVKNAVGTFHHPAAVLIDPQCLSTLPRYQRISGLAEAVKAAAIRDREFFAWIEQHAGPLRDGEADALTDLIERSLRIKSEVVAEDPEERGVRAILNFGHTFGHALESMSGFSVLHGEAVAAGMRMEARLGESEGVTAAGVGERLDEILARRDAHPLPALGQRFDPLTMHAIQTAQDPKQADGRVLTETRTGFLYHGRLLRPAEVIVNKVTVPSPPSPGEGSGEGPTRAADPSSHSTP